MVYSFKGNDMKKLYNVNLKLEFTDEEMHEDPRALEWLKDCEEKIIKWIEVNGVPIDILTDDMFKK